MATCQENVKVSIRIKPIDYEDNQILTIDEDVITLQKLGNPTPRKFRFDKIFHGNTSQIEIYRNVAFPIVEKILQGYNGTIFAYGQTGTGKTYTMTGENHPEKFGIIPNTFNHIFNEISTFSEETTFAITATYLEIYNEEVRDLLSTNPKTKLEIRERSDIGVYVKNLNGYTVDSIQSITDLLNRGNMNRSTSSTLMNKISSRSHAIFSILIESKTNNQVTLGKLNLVDLAGSERLSRTQAKGERLKEASNINQSLSALGNVISALVDEKATHIPYRNSKLTRLLQDSLGGNSKTAMIALITPRQEDYEESLCTLRYATRVKYIKNIVKVNVETKQSLIESFEKEILRLQKRISLINLREEKAIKWNIQMEDEKVEKELEKLLKEKEMILGKISVIQRKILVGGENLLEKAQKQIFLLEESNLQLEDLDKTYEELEVQMAEVGITKIDIEERYLSLQDENKMLDKKIELAQKLLMKYKDEYIERDNDYSKEIENLYIDYKTRMKEVNLADKIIKGVIPKSYLKKIEDKVIWNEEINDYQVLGIAYAGNNIEERCSARRITGSVADKKVGSPYCNYNLMKEMVRDQFIFQLDIAGTITRARLLNTYW